MNKLTNYRQSIVATIGILSLVMSLGISGRAFAAQNVADLSITIVPDKTRVKIGENITYTVTVTNLGPDAALFVGVAHGLADQKTAERPRNMELKICNGVGLRKSWIGRARQVDYHIDVMQIVPQRIGRRQTFGGNRAVGTGSAQVVESSRI